MGRAGTRAALSIFLLALCAAPAAAQSSFRFDGPRFLLDGKPFQILAGELHFQRIPREYWSDRLLKARAMGLNTVCTYVFWNLIEPEPGQWNLGGTNDLAAFIRAAKEVGLYVIVRPGPYACAEWDFGGLPAWLLRTPDIKVRCMDPRYVAAAQAYIRKMAEIVGPLLVARGGPVLMIQIENEYGSYGNDRAYMETLKKTWEAAGIAGPFYTADGATPYMLEAGSLRGAAIGLDPATSEKQFAEAEKLGRNVPVFCSELYPGWLTHWGEAWASVKTEEVVKDLRWLLDNGKSFNLYVFHGGTNFGFFAGANYGNEYQPDVTSYDYDAPLDEMGQPTPKYFAIRDVLAAARPEGAPALPSLPEPLPVIEIPELTPARATSVFDNLPRPIPSPQPKPMEAFNQNFGFILYRTKLVGHHGGKLTITEVRDFANVYADGRYVGSLDRAKKETTIEIPGTEPPVQRLDILVEAMGRINFGQHMIDRKGITDRVTLNGMTLMDWEVFPLPMEPRNISALKFGDAPEETPGAFFQGTFELASTGDTYIDMSRWKKGVVWVNGRNLGRYWEIGPQQRLYCPAPFLKAGRNEIVVFELLSPSPAPLRGVKSLKGD